MRKYEISCTIIIQALSQLKSMYKDDWEVLVGNCDSCLFLGGSDATSLEYISKKLGKETIRSVNNSRSYGRQGSHSLSYNKTGRELMTTDELGVMDNDNCVLFIRGLYPFFSTKYPLEKHPNYGRSGDGNKKFMYDVKERVWTGKAHTHVKPKESRAKRIYTDAQMADTREADRQHRQHSRAAQMRSARNRELLKPKPLHQEFPGIAKTPEQRTAEEVVQMEEILENLEVIEMNQMSEDQLMQYQIEMASMHFNPPPLEYYGTTSMVPDEERRDE